MVPPYSHKQRGEKEAGCSPQTACPNYEATEAINKRLQQEGEVPPAFPADSRMSLASDQNWAQAVRGFESAKPTPETPIELETAAQKA